MKTLIITLAVILQRDLAVGTYHYFGRARSYSTTRSEQPNCEEVCNRYGAECDPVTLHEMDPKALFATYVAVFGKPGETFTLDPTPRTSPLEPYVEGTEARGFHRSASSPIPSCTQQKDVNGKMPICLCKSEHNVACPDSYKFIDMACYNVFDLSFTPGTLRQVSQECKDIHDAAPMRFGSQSQMKSTIPKIRQVFNFSGGYFPTGLNLDSSNPSAQVFATLFKIDDPTLYDGGTVFVNTETNWFLYVKDNDLLGQVLGWETPTAEVTKLVCKTDKFFIWEDKEDPTVRKFNQVGGAGEVLAVTRPETIIGTFPAAAYLECSVICARIGQFCIGYNWDPSNIGNECVALSTTPEIEQVTLFDYTVDVMTPGGSMEARASFSASKKLKIS